jgi:multidrug resistance protein
MKRISVLMATAFVDMIGFAMIFPLLPFYALRLQAPEWMIGWMIAVFSIAQLASAPLWGRVSDRYGRRPAIIVGLLGGAVSYTVFGLATSIWMLFLSRLIQGIGGGTTAVLQAYVGDASEPKDRAKALGWLSSATSAGVMVGPALGSLAYNLGTAAPGLIAAALCLVNASFALRWLPEPKQQAGSAAPDDSPEPKRSISEAVWEVLSAPHREVCRLVWIYAIGMLGFMSTTAVMALYLEQGFGVTAQTIGAFFVLVGALGVVMRALVLGRLVDRFGETRVMRLGATCLALGIFLLPRATNLLGFALLVCLIPVGTALLFPTVSALVSHRVRRMELGQAMGVQQAFGGVARVIGPIWSTAAFQGLGPHVPFYIASSIVVAVVLLAARIPTHHPSAEPVEAS